jgi:fluoroquinolone transport system ATP-binding protein
MIGLLPLSEGDIRYSNKPLSELGKAFFNQIGVSFEQPNLYTKLTGLENLKYYAGLYSVELVPPEQILDMVGLTDAAHKRTSDYSKGMRQRLMFGRSIMHKPDFLFLDEPLAGLDPNTSLDIKDIIREQQARGATILLTTHDMHVADELCDVVAFINEGELVAKDSPRQLKLKYGERAVRVEFSNNGRTQTELLFLDNEQDRDTLTRLIEENRVETVHSQEATLEQIFIRLTGRELTA